jgi:hypothetical protein
VGVDLATTFFGVLEGDDFFAGAIVIGGTENIELYAGMKHGCYLGRPELNGQSGCEVAAKVVVYSKEMLKLRHVCVQSTNSTLRSRESWSPFTQLLIRARLLLVMS